MKVNIKMFVVATGRRNVLIKKTLDWVINNRAIKDYNYIMAADEALFFL